MRCRTELFYIVSLRAQSWPQVSGNSHELVAAKPAGLAFMESGMTDIPDGITRGDILQGIAEFNAGVAHEFAESTSYDLLHNGKRYPPKAVLGLAAKRLLGAPLRPRDFSGGLKSKCFRMLEGAGFQIVPKRDFQAWMLQGNPDYFDIDRYLSEFDYVYWGVPATVHHREMAVGDPVFFWRARGKSKSVAGLIGTGVIVEPCTDKDEVRHPEFIDPEVATEKGTLWNQDQNEKARVKVGVRVSEVRLLPEDGMLPRHDLAEDPILRKLKVITVRTASTFRVSQEEHGELAALWGGVAELTTEQTFSDGALNRLMTTRYERNPRAREACLKHWGFTCQACGMSFGGSYGSIADGFIHVHHRKPLSEIGEEYQVDPLLDLIPLCPNCHAVAHMKKPPYEPAEIREMLGLS
jgi:hypothetical protein